MARKLIMDVDTGTDDAIALMLAALHPDLDLIGVTTVGGNVPLEYTTDNTLRVLDWIEKSAIQVHPGLARPIVRDGLPARKHYDQDTDADPHGSTLPLPVAHSRPSDTGAIDYLIETFRATTDPLTLVATGPLSNIAAVLAIDASVSEAIDELVIMGGGHAITNVTAAAEFNIWADPEAANSVFHTPFQRTVLIPLDATYQALISENDCAELDLLGTPAGTAAARLVQRRIKAYSNVLPGADAAPVHDVLCPAYLVAPEVVRLEHVPVTVETNSDLTLGRTVIDRRHDSRQPPNARVAFSADPATLQRLLINTFG